MSTTLPSLLRRRAVLALVGFVVVVGVLLALPATRHLLGLADAARPADDDAAQATAITADAYAGTLDGATAEVGETGPLAPTGGRSVWAWWTAPKSGPATVLPDLGHPVVRAFADTSSGSFAGLRPADLGPAGTDGTTFGAVGGQRYLLQVSGDASPFSLTLTQDEPATPSNDQAAGAIDVTTALGSAAANAADHTVASARTAGAGPNGTPDVWFAVHAPAAPAADLRLRVAASAVVPADTAVTLTALAGPDAEHLTALGPSGPAIDVTVPAGTTALLELSTPVEAYVRLLTAPAPSGVRTTADTTPPVVTCTAPAGWSTATSVACTATDAGSGLASAADATFTLALNVPDGAATASAATEQRQVCDLAQNCATAGPLTGLQIDHAPPVVACAEPPAGWSGADVRLDCAVTDEGSGLTTPTTVTLSTAVADGTANAAAPFAAGTPACDAAGLCTPVTIAGTAKVDRAAPTVTCDAPPVGWQKAEATVACHGADVGSGLSGSNDVTLTTSVGEGATDDDAATGSKPVCDQAGHCVTAGPIANLQVDRRPPTIECADPGGWRAGASASITCHVADVGSGLADPSDRVLPATITAGTEGPAQTPALEVCDRAGSCTSVGAVGLQLDDKAPVVTCPPVPDGASTGGWLSDLPTVTCTATDAGSGVTQPTGGTLVRTPPASGQAFPAAQACDGVGHCTAAPDLAGVRVDTTAPAITCDPVPGGAQDHDVELSCHATDGDSGLVNPADATFTIRTTVGPDAGDSQAPFTEHEVCDLVGRCSTTADLHLFADVDRTHPPAAPAPSIDAPGDVLAIAAVTGSPAVPVPYALPPTRGGAGSVIVDCAEAPGSLLLPGEHDVTCLAEDDAGQITEAGFTITVRPDATLVPDQAVSGRTVPARVVGGQPGAAVTVELDGVQVLTGTIAGDGAFTGAVTLGPTGDHTLVVRTLQPNGDPLLVVTPLDVRIAGATTTTPTTAPPTTDTTPPTTATPPTTRPGIEVPERRCTTTNTRGHRYVTCRFVTTPTILRCTTRTERGANGTRRIIRTCKRVRARTKYLCRTDNIRGANGRVVRVDRRCDQVLAASSTPLRKATSPLGFGVIGSGVLAVGLGGGLVRRRRRRPPSAPDPAVG